MKKTSKSWVFFVLQLFFIIVVPVALVWLQYGDTTGTFKIPITAILLVILLFLVAKKLLFKPWLDKVKIKIANIETNALTITDPLAIEANKKAWRMFTLAQLACDAFIPLLLFIASIITIKTVEQGIIKLYGCLMFCFVSIVVGIGFKVLEVYSMQLTHEK